MTPRADVIIASQVTLVLFHLLSHEAEGWVQDNVDPAAQWFGGALVVEDRFAGDLAQGMAADGLAVRVVAVEAF